MVFIWDIDGRVNGLSVLKVITGDISRWAMLYGLTPCRITVPVVMNLCHIAKSVNDSKTPVVFTVIPILKLLGGKGSFTPRCLPPYSSVHPTCCHVLLDAINPTWGKSKGTSECCICVGTAPCMSPPFGGGTPELKVTGMSSGPALSTIQLVLKVAAHTLISPRMLDRWTVTVRSLALV